jgi:hypothetical protein
MNPPERLSTADLETVYDLLASAIDRLEVGQAELFLVKLALLQAHALADVGQFRAHLASAAADL